MTRERRDAIEWFLMLMAWLIFALAVANAHGQSTAEQPEAIVWTDPEWCAPCVTLENVLVKLRADGYRVRVFSSTKWPEQARSWRVVSVPTVILYTPRQEIARRGPGTYEELRLWFRSHGLLPRGLP